MRKPIWPLFLIVSGIAIAVVSAAITFMPRVPSEKVQVPPRTAATACHMDLEAISRTLRFVPLEPHERKAAHTILRQAYAETDDEFCRKIGGYVLQRFYMRNLHGEKL